jgi:hypothetical protein
MVLSEVGWLCGSPVSMPSVVEDQRELVDRRNIPLTPGILAGSAGVDEADTACAMSAGGDDAGA